MQASGEEHRRRTARQGVLLAAGAYFAWGLFPLFWKELKAIDATELIAHRIVWSVLFLAVVTHFSGGWEELRGALGKGRLLGLHLLSGGLLTLNWLSYVWAVNHGRILETSLGYYLVPLINVALGRLVLKESLRPLQWVAIGVAALGVVVQCAGVASVPWIGIVVALTFGFYGLLRKRSPLGSLPGLSLETLLYFPLAAGFLCWRGYTGEGALGHVNPWQHFLLLSAGAVTAIPLLLFASGARRIKLATLGLLQYIGPSIAFLLGIWLYGEQVNPLRMISFVLIWSALCVYTFDNLRTTLRRPAG